MGTFLDMFVSYNYLPPVQNEEVDNTEPLYTLNTYGTVSRKKLNTKKSEESDIIRPIEDSESTLKTESSSKYKQVRAMSTLSNSKGLNKNAKIAYDYLVLNGIPRKSAAGIVGNLYHEDLGNPLRTVSDSHGTKAFGVAGFNNKGELPNLMKWARDNHIQGLPGFLDLLDFIVNVAKNRPYLSSVIMNPESTPEDASYAWGRYFEVFGGKTTRVGKDGKVHYVGYLYRNDPEHVKRGRTSAELFRKFNG